MFQINLFLRYCRIIITQGAKKTHFYAIRFAYWYGAGILQDMMDIGTWCGIDKTEFKMI